MESILVVGEESFTLGFELVGIKSRPLSEIENLLQESESVGIIIMAQEDYEKQSAKVKSIIDRAIKPIVVLLSSTDTKGDHLREAVIRALGVDMLGK